MKRILAVLLLCFIVLFGTVPVYAAYSTTIPACASETYVVMDAKTGQVFVEKGMNTRMYPASLTKVLTAILALENADMNALHTMSYEATHSIDPNSTHIALTEDEVVSLEDLMYAMMVESANDAANGIAEYVGGGSIEAFVSLMNEKAAQIGANASHFTNPHGLHNTDLYTTAYDLALITRYALEVPGFRTYFNAPDHTIEPTNKQPQQRYFGTDHSMIVTSQYEYEGATGGKLGYTNDARHTLIVTAKRGDLELICVTMKSDKYEKFEDAAKLLDYCFDSFEQKELAKKDLQGFVVPVYEGETKVQEVRIFPDNSISVWLHKSVALSQLHLQYDVPESYQKGEEIAPQLRLRLQNGTETMHSDLGTFPLSYDLTYIKEGVSFDSETGLPIKDTSAFWNTVFVVLRFAGIILGGLFVLFVIFVIIVRARAAAAKRKKRGQARRAPAMASSARSRPVRITVLPEDNVPRRRMREGGQK